MTEPENGADQGSPPRKSLTKAAVWTFAGAAVLTVLFVMPAEYGIDPTGLGERIGLMRFQTVEAPDVGETTRVVEGQFPDIHPDDPFDYYEPETLSDPFSRSGFLTLDPRLSHSRGTTTEEVPRKRKLSISHDRLTRA